jgi:pyruvate-ferredoxin/flavodoxin oxidoreductase
MTRTFATIDGNEAAARIAHAINEVVAIYPITPASSMGELADAWSAAGKRNIWGEVPEVIEMQSEGGAAGAVHGALQAGALTTTFTASQGLLLMIPNMFKIAGELTPTVIHIAARSVATHALSIFGDHSDVMACRATGFGMLFSSSVQQAHDNALIAQAASLSSRIPHLHVFDGFRTSHEVNKVELIDAPTIRAMIDEDLVAAHRRRALNPENPVLRGTAQNPDVFFQAREAVNPFYRDAPRFVNEAMDRFAQLTGRRYRLFDYQGHPEAESVVVIMGSGAGAAREAVRARLDRGEEVGLLEVHLYRPFCVTAMNRALPGTVERLAVLDRTKEPGATGEPLYLDMVSGLLESVRQGERDRMPTVVGGRYGLSSKELTPSMVAGVFDELTKDRPRHGFTVGIVDDVTNLSLGWDKSPEPEPDDVFRAIFFGLGSDGTVGANKNAVKIVGENTELFAQGYFVYDSKKSGAVTESHLRFSPRPIDSSYLIQSAQFVACHQFHFLEKLDVLRAAMPGGTFLLDAPHPRDRVWAKLPRNVQVTILEKKLRVFVIDAHAVAQKAGLGGRINTIMQTCFFALAGVLPKEKAIAEIKAAVEKSYAKAGRSVLDANKAAVDHALENLFELEIPDTATSIIERPATVPKVAPDFVQRVTAMIIEGHGDRLPVSALPVDGTFPTGTAKFEKRSIAREIPIWDSSLCIQCGWCAIACPHAAIRTKAYATSELENAPAGFKAMPYRGKELEGDDLQLTVQVAPDDCTGCGVCVDICPARSKEVAKHKSINMESKLEHGDVERERYEFFLSIPEAPRTKLRLETVKGSQLAQPLFEYSGACAGCGETPYLKLMTQLFGDRALVANATGCSSVYGGNLPTTPWSRDPSGRGPAWSNSLFEDNAEFGLGMQLAVEHQRRLAQSLVVDLGGELGPELVASLLRERVSGEAEIAELRAHVEELEDRLKSIDHPAARRLQAVSSALIPRSVWIIGGDGWAYDIGFGGVDHVLASGRNVNILVLDTEVYSNTGGQASKATPRGAVAKFAASGKPIGKKDLGMIAMAYGNVYVGQIALGANMRQTVQAMAEAESYPGTSLLIAYSTCIAHGVDMSRSISHMKDAEAAGYWPLYRYDPRRAERDAHPFHLDSKKPSKPFRDYAMTEARYAMLSRSQPERSNALIELAQRDIDERWRYYEQLAGLERNPVTD